MQDFEDQLLGQLPALRRYAWALCGDVERADDLVQDVVERALNKRQLFQQGSNFKAWIFTLIRHQHINNARRKVIAFEEFHDDEHISPSTTDQGNTAKDMSSALQSIDEQQRQIVLLVGLEGMSYKETSEILNIPVGTVMSKLARGREKMRDWMKSQEKSHLRTVQ